MSLRKKIEQLSLRVVVTLPMSALMVVASLYMFLRPAAPDPHAQLGHVEIDLAQLDYKLRFEDLQAAGMFTGIRCKKCDFSATGSTPATLVWDYKDTGFVGNLYLAQRDHTLQLSFFGKDVLAGQQRLDQALQALGAKFPGDAGAIKLIARGFIDYPDGQEPVPR